MFISILISIFNIASVYFAAKNNRLTWIFGIFAALLTSYVMYDDMWFQSIFQILTAGFCVYSFIRWKSNSKANDDDVHLSYCITTFIIAFGIIPLTTIMFWDYILNDIDFQLTLICVMATILLYMKNVAAWIYWIFTDIAFITIGMVNDNFEYVIIYFILLILAIYGFARNYDLALKNGKNNPFSDFEFLVKYF